MSTVTISASKVAFAASTSISSWASDYAMQGAWGSDRRVGMIAFSALRSGIDWSAQAISEIRLRLTFGNAGASRGGKSLGLYAATRNSPGGRGSAMLGDSFGSVTLTSAGRLTDETIVLSPSSNAAVFAAMAAWITGGSTSAIAIYKEETASSGNYSSNYLNITAAKLTVDYDLAGSALTVTPTAIGPATAVAMTVDPISVEGTLTHTFRSIIGGTSTTLAANQAASVTRYDVPAATVTGWFSAMRTAGLNSRVITLALDSYVDGSLRGTRTVDVILTVPEAARPVIGTWTPRRYGSYIDDQSQTQYRDDVSGNHVWADIAVSVSASAAPDCDKATVKVYRWPGDDDGQRALVTTLGSNVTISSYSAAHAADMFGQSVTQALDAEYTWQVEVDNGYFIETMTARVGKSAAPLHIAGSGYGVGVGKYSSGTQQDPRFEVAWPMYYRQCGYVEIGDGVVPAGGYLDMSVTFPQAFADVPVVVVGFASDSSAGAFGKCCCAVLYDSSLTASGFKVRIFNGDSANRQPNIAWIAVGIAE